MIEYLGRTHSGRSASGSGFLPLHIASLRQHGDPVPPPTAQADRVIAAA